MPIAASYTHRFRHPPDAASAEAPFLVCRFEFEKSSISITYGNCIQINMSHLETNLKNCTVSNVKRSDSLLAPPPEPSKL